MTHMRGGAVFYNQLSAKKKPSKKLKKTALMADADIDAPGRAPLRPDETAMETYSPRGVLVSPLGQKTSRALPFLSARCDP